MTQPTGAAELPEALPCPFCGGEPTIIERPDNIDGTEFFYALACYCGGYSACAHKMAVRKTPEVARADAIAAWNRRAQPAGAATQAAQETVSRDDKTWCRYVAGMIVGWIEMENAQPVQDESFEEEKDRWEEAIAGIIGRRLWALPTPQPAVTAGAVDAQRVKAVIEAMLDANTTHEYQAAADDAKELIASLAAQHATHQGDQP